MRRLKGRAVTLDYDDEDPKESPESFLDAIREAYKTVRMEQTEND